MRWTAYPDVDAFVESILPSIQGILGDKLVGLYVFGSITTGAYDEGISDLDLAAAVKSDLDQVEFDRLERMHLDLVRRHPTWEERLEIGYIPVEKMRCFEPGTVIPLISPGEPFHRIEVVQDWLLNLQSVRQQGITLCGPSPDSLIDPLPKEAIARALADFMWDWKEWISRTELVHQRNYQSYMVITMCRSLYTYQTGEIASKRLATDWGKERFPAWGPLISEAMLLRETTGGIDDSGLPETLRFVNFAIDTILGGSQVPVQHREDFGR